jgi:UDP-N-acetyl-alpha-D-muramoyl-L-alanyl-L-glutamate epimerase
VLVKQLTFSQALAGYPRCTFLYDIQGTKLTKYLDVSSVPEEVFRAVDQSTVNHIVAHIGMAYVPHLFAVDDFDVVNVRPLRLSAEGVQFYETYLQRGLAELRFHNKLDVAKRVVVNVEPGAPRYRAGHYSPRASALLLNGGGKDTAVAAEILREIDVPFVWLSLGVTPAMTRLIHLSQNSCSITLRQGGSLRALRRMTRYSGHRPFNSLVAFVSLLAAFIKSQRYIVTANEYSANFGNVVLGGFQVNHQYAKSHEFESYFTRYVRTEILPDVTYFSILRPLYEVQIAKLFTSYPKYFTSFRSCNLGHKADLWCLQCPKCAFILLALAPHLSQQDLIRIFGANAFAFPPLRQWIMRFCSQGIRPFECIGTRRESLVALWMSHRRHPDDPFITSLYKDCCTGQNLTELEHVYMNQIDRPHNIPPELRQAVMGYFRDRLGPDAGHPHRSVSSI